MLATYHFAYQHINIYRYCSVIIKVVLHTCKQPLPHSRGDAIPVVHAVEFQVNETAKIEICQLQLSKSGQSEQKHCAIISDL